MEGCLPKNERRNSIMAKRVKTNYDRGYVNAMDKIRVFIESSSKVMYVDAPCIKSAARACA